MMIMTNPMMTETKKKTNRLRCNQLFLLFFLFNISLVSAQNSLTYKYVIYFKYKDSSQLAHPKKFLGDKAISRRKKYGIKINVDDVPVNSKYVHQILSLRNDFILHGVSKWKNCMIVESKDSIPTYFFSSLSFVERMQCIYKGNEPKHTSSQQAPPIKVFSSVKSTLSVRQLRKSSYGQTQTQVNMLNLAFLHQKKLWGQNMHIAVFDGGFQHVDTISAFQHLYSGNRIKHVYDFASRESDVYGDGDHGTKVLACMAGFVPGKYIGNSPLADYSLFRTEDAHSETIVEEFNWLIAAEFCDSAGVDVINSSLGYTKFDKDQPIDFSYSFSKLDGRTGIASFAAETVAKKGVFVCNSAGNSGSDSWKFIGVPADAHGIFSVGAVDKLKNKASFSSFGPTSDQRIKPTICAMGVNAAVISGAGKITSANGTSFSSPIFCSALVCLVQKYPKHTPEQILKIIQSTASNSEKPNASIGYGIPDFEKAFFSLKKQKH